MCGVIFWEREITIRLQEISSSLNAFQTCRLSINSSICSCRRCFAHSAPDCMTGGVFCSPNPASSRIDAGRLCRLERCFEMLAGLHHSI